MNLRYQVDLSQTDREALEALLKGGQAAARKFNSDGKLTGDRTLGGQGKAPESLQVSPDGRR